MASSGRPKSVIPREKLAYFVDLNFTRVEIAGIFSVSERTISNFLKEYELKKEDRWNDLDDEDLDEIIEELVRVNPSWGQKMIHGAIESMGLKVKRDDVRSSLRRVDPEGVEMRKRRALHRRVYQVAGPNALWHIDGHHKLIRWRFVVHGGIDGYSRIPVFLDCHTDNKAISVLKSFKAAVSVFGLPQRVRSDQGAENLDVCQFMLDTRGTGRGSFITGKSVHNQRIERLWRDVFKACLAKYYHLFYDMEDRRLLNPLDDLDLFCLHYVFAPLINCSLQHFRFAYMHHRLRTAVNKTPLQLWVSGVVNGMTAIDFLGGENDIQRYGVEPDVGDHHHNGEDMPVVLPPTRLPFPREEIEAFRNYFPVDEDNLTEPLEQVEYFQAVRSYLSERWQLLNEDR